MNRLKILGAFETVPNIIEMARNKAKNYPLNSLNPKSVKLHKNVHDLRITLVRVLPPLINKLVPTSSLGESDIVEIDPCVLTPGL